MRPLPEGDILHVRRTVPAQGQRRELFLLPRRPDVRHDVPPGCYVALRRSDKLLFGCDKLSLALTLANALSVDGGECCDVGDLGHQGDPLSAGEDNVSNDPE